jgi:maleylacetoacetate isomerase
MKLYTRWQSVACWRVRWALRIKRVAYDTVHPPPLNWEQEPENRIVILRADGSPPPPDLSGEFVALPELNPMNQVPMLVLDDGRVLTESVAIIEWLDETTPDPPLLPKDPWQRARARMLVQLVNAGIHPLQDSVVKQAVSDDRNVQWKWGSRWIERGLIAYEHHVAGTAGPFSFGAQLTMADLFLVTALRSAERHHVTTPRRLPRIRGIYEAAMRLDDCHKTDPDAAFPGPMPPSDGAVD